MYFFSRKVAAWIVLVAIVGSVGTTTSVYLVSRLLSPNPQPAFTIEASPSQHTILSGGDTRHWATVKLRPVNNFTGIVSLDVTAPPAIVTKLYLFDPIYGTTVVDQVALGRERSLNLTLVALYAGNYSVVVSGRSGSLVQSVTLNIVARGLSFATNPSHVLVHGNPCGALSICPPDAITVGVQVTLTSLNGFGGNFTLGCHTQPSRIDCSVPRSVMVPVGGSASFSMTVSVAPTYGGSGDVSIDIYSQLGVTRFGFGVGWDHAG